MHLPYPKLKISSKKAVKTLKKMMRFPLKNQQIQGLRAFWGIFFFFK
jgi:hypothetical protein